MSSSSQNNKTTSKLSVASSTSTSRLDRVTDRSSASVDDEPSSLNDNNNRKASVVEAPTTEASLTRKFSQSTPVIQQALHYEFNNLGRSKSRQKKFLRLFPSVPREERVLNHYACALVADILLQGHLYITYNYFAFHSNVFGYVRKEIIPIMDVTKISKEKTARIIPNAIGITTNDGKKIFGSLMARDVTYRLVVSLWKRCHSSNEQPIIPLPPEDINSVSTPPTDVSSSATESPDDSAIHSRSNTPDKEPSASDISDSGIPLYRHASAVSLNLLKSSSIFDIFSSRQSLVRKDERPPGGVDTTPDVTDGGEEKDHRVLLPRWAYWGIILLLVVVCISAAVLWYRMFVLRGNLELHLLTERSAQPGSKSPMNSLYSPEMQELVDNLHLLLSSRSPNEERKSLSG